MKLTEQQIWQCNNTEDGGIHICLDHQNVVDFARSIEREIGFAKAELWIKRINDAVEAERTAMMQLFTDPENQPTQHGTVTVEYMQREIEAEREACAKLADAADMYNRHISQEIAAAIRARGNT